MKTINRGLLMKAVAAGKMVSTASRHFDDMTGEERRDNTIPARISSGYGDFIEGQCNLRPSDFRSASGSAWENPDGTITLYVHSNCSYDLKLRDGEVLTAGARVGLAKAKRPENVRMQEFLASNGIQAMAKYARDGSMRGTWRLYNGAVAWTDELRDKLTALGFTDFDGEPLGKFSGNGGTFSVSVRGHNELLEAREGVAA